SSSMGSSPSDQLFTHAATSTSLLAASVWAARDQRNSLAPHGTPWLAAMNTIDTTLMHLPLCPPLPVEEYAVGGQKVAQPSLEATRVNLRENRAQHRRVRLEVAAVVRSDLGGVRDPGERISDEPLDEVEELSHGGGGSGAGVKNGGGLVQLQDPPQDVDDIIDVYEVPARFGVADSNRDDAPLDVSEDVGNHVRIPVTGTVHIEDSYRC